MPKRAAGHNQTPPELALSTTLIAMHKPRSVADLLQSRARLTDLAARAKATVSLRDEVHGLLPPSLGSHLAHVSEHRSELTLWADSAAFCARLRFESARLREPVAQLLGRPVLRIKVRVMPKGATPGRQSDAP